MALRRRTRTRKATASRRRSAKKTKKKTKTKTKKKRVTAARKRRKAPTKAKARTRARTARPKRRPTAPRRAAASAPRTAPAPAAGAPADDLAALVEEALRDRGYEPVDATVVAVLTAIGTGYRQGPASPPSWLRVDVDGPIAAGMVERYATGDRAHDIDRSTHRSQVRATVGFNLDQLASDTLVGDAERDVLTSFCLGSWDPALDQNAERNDIASFVVPWYLAGRA
jgi:hypothetical protein